MSISTTGFPSPAQGYEKETFDFNRILIIRPAATFVMQYEDKPMYGEGLLTGDFIIIDSSIVPKKGLFAVLEENGEFKCTRLNDVSGNIFGIIIGIVRTGLI
jgi:DNA polymerase V